MSDYLIGLDLGQQHDYTALSVLRRLVDPGPERSETHYQVGHLQRYPLGTRYTEIVRRVASMKEQLPNGARLVVDATGVGQPVVDMFVEAGLYPIAIWIHGGDSVSRDGRTYRVPKRDLAGVLQVLLQNGRLKVQERLPEASVLRAEMQNFKAKIDPQTGHDSYAADWREGDHDDLILSVAMACWYGEHGRPAEPLATTRPIVRQAAEQARRRFDIT